MATLPMGANTGMLQNARVMAGLLAAGDTATIRRLPSGDLEVAAAGAAGTGQTVAVAFRRWGDALVSSDGADAISARVLARESARQEAA